MAHESFEDETVAAALNERFVAVKVDRKERPDIDAVYMSAVTATTGHGGWPMTVFLMPEGDPFYSGTYFPASTSSSCSSRSTRPGAAARPRSASRAATSRRP